MHIGRLTFLMWLVRPGSNHLDCAPVRPLRRDGVILEPFQPRGVEQCSLVCTGDVGIFVVSKCKQLDEGDPRVVGKHLLCSFQWEQGPVSIGVFIVIIFPATFSCLLSAPLSNSVATDVILEVSLSSRLTLLDCCSLAVRSEEISIAPAPLASSGESDTASYDLIGNVPFWFCQLQAWLIFFSKPT